jgi:choline kinase
MGDMGKNINKALFPVDGKAIISHIINKFPSNTEFVIGLGFLGKQVREYLQIAHRETQFVFTEVDNYSGQGSGPGYSLLCCKEYLQKPFYFVSCDTLWDNPLHESMNTNWFGVAKVSSEVSHNYLNLRIENNIVVELRDKVKVTESDYQAFVGLCYIHDFSIFWDSLDSSVTIKGEVQVSNGMNDLIEKTKVIAKSIDWTDVGDADKYRIVISRYENFDFSKQNEAIYFCNQKVIKLFVDPQITMQRVKKSQLNTNVFPAITNHIGQFYAYDFQPGATLYQVNSQQIFRNLLDWLGDELWEPITVSPDIIHSTCKKFYRDKTLDRLKMYWEKYNLVDSPSVVNGLEIPSINKMFEEVPWEKLYEGIPCFMHGDLQFDNILFDTDTSTFNLLDWRQDFGGHIEFGDLYYDLAKLYGGIVLNYDYIKLNLLSYSEDNSEILFDYAQRYQAKYYLEILSQYIIQNGYDLQKVKIIVSLIYLNMSPLHHYPFDKMLYSLGRELLMKQLEELKPITN